jgi:hypothetical protein
MQVSLRTAQRDQVGPGVAERFLGAPSRPELSPDGLRLDTVIGHSRGHHAGSDRIVGQYPADCRGVAHD